MNFVSLLRGFFCALLLTISAVGCAVLEDSPTEEISLLIVCDGDELDSYFWEKPEEHQGAIYELNLFFESGKYTGYELRTLDTMKLHRVRMLIECHASGVYAVGFGSIADLDHTKINEVVFFGGDPIRELGRLKSSDYFTWSDLTVYADNDGQLRAAMFYRSDNDRGFVIKSSCLDGSDELELEPKKWLEIMNFFNGKISSDGRYEVRSDGLGGNFIPIDLPHELVEHYRLDQEFWRNVVNDREYRILTYNSPLRRREELKVLYHDKKADKWGLFTVPYGYDIFERYGDYLVLEKEVDPGRDHTLSGKVLIYDLKNNSSQRCNLPPGGILIGIYGDFRIASYGDVIGVFADDGVAFESIERIHFPDAARIVASYLNSSKDEVE